VLAAPDFSRDQVVARLYAKRPSDKENYPKLLRVHEIYNNVNAQVDKYINMDYIEVLRYIVDDQYYAKKIKGFEGRCGDSKGYSRRHH
jgi:hypothetical protein